MFNYTRMTAQTLLLIALVTLGLGAWLPASADESSESPYVVVESAELIGSSSLGSWFGGGATPVLVLVLRNDSGSPITPQLDLAWRDGTGPAHQIGAPDLEEIAAGTRVTVEVPVRFDGFAQGEHLVEGVVSAGGRESPVEASATVGPWGVYGLLVVGVLVASAMRTRWVVAKMNRDDEEEGPIGPVPLRKQDEPVSETVLEERAMATIERFAAKRQDEVEVPRQRERSGGRRAEAPAAPRSHKASTRWLTRR